MTVDLEFQKIKVNGAQVEVESTVDLLGEDGGLVSERFQAEVAGQQAAPLLVRPDVISRAPPGHRLRQPEHLLGPQ